MRIRGRWLRQSRRKRERRPDHASSVSPSPERFGRRRRLLGGSGGIVGAADLELGADALARRCRGRCRGACGRWKRCRTRSASVPSPASPDDQRAVLVPTRLDLGRSAGRLGVLHLAAVGGQDAGVPVLVGDRHLPALLADRQLAAANEARTPTGAAVPLESRVLADDLGSRSAGRLAGLTGSPPGRYRRRAVRRRRDGRSRRRLPACRRAADRSRASAR